MGLDDNINPTSAPSLRRPPVQQNASLDSDRHHIYRKVVGMLIWASLVRPGISDSLHIYQLLQELQQHLQRQTFDFGNIETQYNLSNAFSEFCKCMCLHQEYERLMRQAL